MAQPVKGTTARRRWRRRRWHRHRLDLEINGKIRTGNNNKADLILLGFGPTLQYVAAAAASQDKQIKELGVTETGNLRTNKLSRGVFGL